jgi:hypothetical protein
VPNFLNVLNVIWAEVRKLPFAVHLLELGVHRNSLCLQSID